MKVLVTGADGLLGSNLVRELLERDFQVSVLVQRGSRSGTLENLPLEKITGDLLDENTNLAEIAAGRDVTFHCAAITNQWADADLTWKVNFEGTKRVLDACIEAEVKKLVFVGSASSFQFGTIERPGDETAPFPDAYRGVAYVESKHEATQLVKEYVEKHGLDAVIVCPTFMLGRYDSRPSSGELIRQFIVRGLRFTSPGGRNFVHVRDVAKAMVNAIEGGRKGECYILGGENLTYLDFFTKVASVAGTAPPRVVLPRSLILMAGATGSLYEKVMGKKVQINYRIASLALLGTYYSPAKAIGELGMPQTPIERAVEDSIKSLKEYGHIKVD